MSVRIFSSPHSTRVGGCRGTSGAARYLACLSFEKIALPMAVKQCLGIQTMKDTAVSKLLQFFSFEQCLRSVPGLPIHCATLGATTLGQIEDDGCIAQCFAKLSTGEVADFRPRASKPAGPQLENWTCACLSWSGRIMS